MLTFSSQRTYRAAVKQNASSEAISADAARSILWCSPLGLNRMFRDERIEKTVIGDRVFGRKRDIDRIVARRRIVAAALTKKLVAAALKGQRIEHKDGMRIVGLDPKDPRDVSEMEAILCHVCEEGMIAEGLMLSVICQRRVGRGWRTSTAHLRVADAYAMDIDDLRRDRKASLWLYENVCANLQMSRRQRRGGTGRSAAAE